MGLQLGPDVVHRPVPHGEHGQLGDRRALRPQAHPGQHHAAPLHLVRRAVPLEGVRCPDDAQVLLVPEQGQVCLPDVLALLIGAGVGLGEVILLQEGAAGGLGGQLLHRQPHLPLGLGGLVLAQQEVHIGDRPDDQGGQDGKIDQIGSFE